MDEGDTWITLFFSGSCPSILNTDELEGQEFRPFCPEDDNWELRHKADVSRIPHANSIQVLWLWIKGRRKYIGKVVSETIIKRVLRLILYQFPCYSRRDATIQLHRIGVPLNPERIDDAMYEFDRFHREARAYSHMDLFCPARERIYFPKFHGVMTDIPKSRFHSGYYHERAVVLEAIKPDLHSRRVLSEVVNHQSESLDILKTLSERFCTTPTVISLSPFEQEWYHSLLKDRLRRLDALHRIGITHGDINDSHFRLPNDFYDTVLYDFSESYTFSRKQPFRVCGGRLRPLRVISEGERERVLLHILNRAASRDFRSHLIYFNRKASVAGTDSQHISSVDNALWKSLDTEELLELIILRVSHHPDDFSMPTLNSIFPFLEAVCPNSDLCWYIRRGRLLHQYESVWAVFCDDATYPQSITFDFEPQFQTIEKMQYTCFLLCLIPHSWGIMPMTFDFAGLIKLRKYCARFVSTKLPGEILSRDEFWKEAGTRDIEL